jgi:hypothetical protein
MIIKRVMLAALCALAVSAGGTPAHEARGQRGAARTARARKRPGRARPRKPARPPVVQIMAGAKDEFTDPLTVRGEIISVGAGNFTVRDGRGLDTVVYLFPGTVYKIGAANGSERPGGAEIIMRALVVEIDGLLNSSYQMKANVIKTTEAQLEAARAIQAVLPQR